LPSSGRVADVTQLPCVAPSGQNTYDEHIDVEDVDPDCIKKRRNHLDETNAASGKPPAPTTTCPTISIGSSRSGPRRASAA